MLDYVLIHVIIIVSVLGAANIILLCATSAYHNIAIYTNTHFAEKFTKAAITIVVFRMCCLVIFDHVVYPCSMCASRSDLFREIVFSRKLL